MNDALSSLKPADLTSRNNTRTLPVLEFFFFCARKKHAISHRFFEYKVTRMLQHCLPLELWTQGATVFSGGVLFVTVYPWVVTALALLLPFTLIALFCGLILIHMKIWNMTKQVRTNSNASSTKQGRHFVKNIREVLTALPFQTNKCLVKDYFRDTILLCGQNISTAASLALQQIFASPKTSHDEVRTNIMLLIIIGVFVACELPNAVVYAVKDLASAATTSTAGFHNAVYITECFSLVHSSLNFVLYTVLSPDFRKTMKRMFCRLCIRDDEYYEPVVCCGACRERNTSSRSSTKSSSSDVTETSNKTPTAAPDAYDSDGDIWV